MIFKVTPMKVQFNIEYQTVFGEELFIDILCFDGKNDGTKEAVKMTTIDGKPDGGCEGSWP